MPPSDTTAAASEAQLESLRRLGTEGRLLLGLSMSDDAREIALEGLRCRYPEYSEAEARRALFRLIYGDDLADRVERALAAR